MSQTILVVDDSPTVVKFVSVSLKAKGYQVVVACDGMDALEKMSSMADQVDLIIGGRRCRSRTGHRGGG